MTSNGLRTRRDASIPPRGPPPTVGGTALLLAIMVGVLVSVSYPTASAGLAAVALSARYVALPLARGLRKRTDDWDFWPVCIPGTEVCLGA